MNRIGHPTLTLAQIYAALTYYHANRDVIEADIAAEEADAKSFKSSEEMRNNAVFLKE